MNQIEVTHCYKQYYLFRVNRLQCEGLESLTKIISFKNKLRKKKIVITHCVIQYPHLTIMVPLQNCFFCASYMEGTIFFDTSILLLQDEKETQISVLQLSNIIDELIRKSRKIELQCKLFL